MRTPRFPKVKAGQWIQPIKRGHLMACCDCSLVHRVDFRIVNDRVQLRADRAIGHTKALRKRNRIQVRTT